MTVTILHGPAMPADNGVNGRANPQISSRYEAINPVTASKTQKKYQERNKRLRPDGLTQYINLGDTDEPSYMHFLKDPWDDGTTASLTLKDNDHFKFLILGAGISGLLFVVWLLKDARFQSKDIVIVNTAAGFSGAWYWNQYPGIMCDVKSYIYMPLLEETGYMPKHKYTYGKELCEQANCIAQQWSLDSQAMFCTVISQCTWDDSTAGWTVKMTQRARAGDTTTTASVHADFIMLVPGLLNHLKLPKLPSWGKFQGPSFMASHWDYKVTGRSQEAPEMSKLQDKRVGIIGTGASAVQAVLHLAQWSQELLVFQHMLASVDVQAQKATDEQE